MMVPRQLATMPPAEAGQVADDPIVEASPNGPTP
jgi:hypothetical protein